MQKQKKKQEPSRLEKVTAFVKEFAALITAITALVAAIVGLLFFLYGKEGGTSLFPKVTPVADCVSYTRGFIQTGMTANDGMLELYVVSSPDTLTSPHLLVLNTRDGKLAGMTIFVYDLQKTQFVLKSIVDRRCYEIPQGADNIIKPVSFANGNTAAIKLSDDKSYKLKLLYDNNRIHGEFIDGQ